MERILALMVGLWRLEEYKNYNYIYEDQNDNAVLPFVYNGNGTTKKRMDFPVQRQRPQRVQAIEWKSQKRIELAE